MHMSRAENIEAHSNLSNIEYRESTWSYKSDRLEYIFSSLWGHWYIYMEVFGVEYCGCELLCLEALVLSNLVICTRLRSKNFSYRSYFP